MTPIVLREYIKTISDIAISSAPTLDAAYNLLDRICAVCETALLNECSAPADLDD